MKITELKVQGFKSFVDPVHLRVEPGLTGIVGPNGCGKSNVLESLRWVMGATSARALRGGEMDDVIFSGTDRRPPRDIAEVTITLDNTDRRAPAPFTEAPVLEVSRRIRRAAGSTFRVNGKEVRARDVQLLFADASTGANSPALVRQNQVSELINARPENRRRIIEEASGIAGLYARRHEAELRLRGAETNLERLDDILKTMSDQLAGLKRQARQASRWRALADEARGLEAALMARRLAAAVSGAAAAREAVLEAERALIVAAGDVRRAEEASRAADAGIPALREEQAVAEAVLRRLDGKRIELERDLAAAETALKTAESELQRIAADTDRESALRKDARAGLERLAAENASLPVPEALAAAVAEAEDLAARADDRRAVAEHALAEAKGQEAVVVAQRAALVRARDEAAGLARQRAAARDAAQAALAATSTAGPEDSAIAQARAREAEARAAAETAADAADHSEREADAATQAEARAREAARLAQNTLDRLSAEISGLEAIAAPERKGRWARALDAVTVDEGCERALAAALGDDLDAALDPEAPVAWTGSDGAEPVQWPDGITPLSAHVRAPQALSRRLAAVGLLADGAGPPGPLARGLRIVTRAGDLWRWDGFVVRAGAPSPTAARLEQRNTLARLKEALPAAQAASSEAAKTAAAARARSDAAQAASRSARAAAPRAFNALAEAKERVARLDRDLERAAAQRASAAAELARRSEEWAAAQDALAAAGERLAAAPSPGGEAAQKELAVEAARARDAAADARGRARALRAETEQRARRRQQVEAETAEWTRRDTDAARRLDALARAAFDAENRREGAKAAPGAVMERRRALLGEAPKAEARKAAADDALAQAESVLRQARDTERAAASAQSALREARGAAASRAEAAASRVRDMEEQARRSFQANPDDLERIARAALGDALDRLGEMEAEARLAKVNRDRDQLGGVNLRAEEEAADLESRTEILSAERDDLTAAIAKLRAGIDEINAEGRERLLAAFEIVHGHFRVLFETLFDGGSAELRLTESDDPLGGGLEVFACPPGKRLQSMSLMSGGEQALTASALIFAVFLSNPAPICVLDEVDAPLDDSNVDRYCRLLDEMRKRTETRFLVITHHPITMARMDRLFGVTMAERGVSQVVAVDLQKAEALIGQV